MVAEWASLRLRVIDPQVRVWSFGGKPKNQLNGYGWIGESQVSQWIAASYIIPSQEGGFDLVVGTLPGPLSGACTGHLLKVCGVGSPVRSGDFGRLASSSLKRGMFGQVLHLVLLLGSCWRCVNRGRGSVKVR